MTSIGHRLFWHYEADPHIVRPGIFLLANGMADIVD